MPLDELALKNATPCEKPFRLWDGGSLCLLVSPSGSKLWRFKYYFAGKNQWLPLGAYPEVTLESAREKRNQALLLIREGRNPSREQKAAELWQFLEARDSFKSVALDFITKMGGRWSERHRANSVRRLKVYILPALGNRPIGKIEPQELLEMLRKIEASGMRETAARVCTLCSQILKYGISCGVCSRNAAAGLRRALTVPKSSNKREIHTSSGSQTARG